MKGELKMKTYVEVAVTYSYEVEIPEDMTEVSNIVDFSDNADPIYRKLSRVLSEAHIDHDVYISSIVDAETGEMIYEI